MLIIKLPSFRHFSDQTWHYRGTKRVYRSPDLKEEHGHPMDNRLQLGQKASVTKIFSEEEVFKFADLSLDKNPLHLDNNFGHASIFGQRVVHGILVASLFSGLIGMKLPGPGSIYLGQNLVFKAPVTIDEAVTATVEIIKIREDKPIVTLRTVCINSAGTTVIEGEAVVKYPLST
jgi:enoyl-CoA hydratase